MKGNEGGRRPRQDDSGMLLCCPEQDVSSMCLSGRYYSITFTDAIYIYTHTHIYNIIISDINFALVTQVAFLSVHILVKKALRLMN